MQALELKVDVQGLDQLLEFLSNSFSGGTDVDAPLKLSLARLNEEQWQQVKFFLFFL